jgi:hypothetical protein
MNAGTGRAGVISAHDDASSMDKLVSINSLLMCMSTSLRCSSANAASERHGFAAMVHLCAPYRSVLRIELLAHHQPAILYLMDC